MNSESPLTAWRDGRSAHVRITTFLAKTSLWLLLASLTFGCWAPAIEPDADALKRIHVILLVPVESPPLEVQPDLLAQREPAYRHYQNMALDFPAQTLVYRTTGGITIAGKISRDTLNNAEVTSARFDGDRERSWTPSQALALQAKTLLADENFHGVLSKTVYRLPLTDSERGPGLQRWRDAIQTWYGQDQTLADHRRDGRFDSVLELGVGGYRIFEGQLSLQVLLKLVDPVSRRVLARARDEGFIVDDAAAASLMEDGKAFKQRIADLSVPLIRKALREIGLQASVRFGN